MRSRSRFGEARHFWFYMGAACVAGAAIGLVAGLWNWSDGLVFGVAFAAVLAIGTLATREEMFRPATRRQRKPGARADA